MPAFTATGPARLPVPGPRGVGRVCPDRVRPRGPLLGPRHCRSSRLASAGGAAGPPASSLDPLPCRGCPRRLGLRDSPGPRG